jgi:hypothetical protein
MLANIGGLVVSDIGDLFSKRNIIIDCHSGSL